MTEAIVSDAAATALRAAAAASYPRRTCGLLIGRSAGHRVRVERVLACPNAVPAVERSQRFVIETRAVVNVCRALRATDARIVGFFHSQLDDGSPPAGVDLCAMRRWSKRLWIIVPAPAGAPRPPTGWWLDPLAGSAPRQIMLQLERTLEHRVPSCPDGAL